MRAQTTGSFAVFSTNDGTNLTPRARKSRALLAYLLSNAGVEIPKAHIIGLLWGDRGEAQARSSLRQVLHELREIINKTDEIICSDREHIWLRADNVTEDLADEANGYMEPFQDLGGITPEFDDWLAAERVRRAKRRTAALKAEAEELLRTGRGEDSIILADRMRAIDPYDEDALRLGMEAEFERGQPGAIAERYRATAALLAADLGVLPSDETRSLRDRLIARLTARPRSGSPVETDQLFFGRRAAEEREAAAKAETQAAREAHQMIADKYEELAIQLMTSKPHE